MRRLLLMLGLLLGGTGSATGRPPPITSSAQAAWNKVLIDMTADATACAIPDDNTSCGSVDSPFSFVKQYIRLHQAEFKQVTPWKQTESSPTDETYNAGFTVYGGQYHVIAYVYEGTTFLLFARDK